MNAVPQLAEIALIAHIAKKAFVTRRNWTPFPSVSLETRTHTANSDPINCWVYVNGGAGFRPDHPPAIYPAQNQIAVQLALWLLSSNIAIG